MDESYRNENRNCYVHVVANNCNDNWAPLFVVLYAPFAIPVEYCSNISTWPRFIFFWVHREPDISSRNTKLVLGTRRPDFFFSPITILSWADAENVNLNLYYLILFQNYVTGVQKYIARKDMQKQIEFGPEEWVFVGWNWNSIPLSWRFNV